MNELYTKLSYKKHINAYLDELEIFCGKRPQEYELISLNETESIRAKSASIIDKGSRKFHINFDEKGSVQFEKFITDLHEGNSSQIYVWTPLSDSCGLFKVSSILDFNFDFPFDVHDDGLIALFTDDFEDEIILDFSYDQEESSKKILEIELHGRNWPAIDFQ